jgi:cytochrome c-type biogenesis protein CcmH/NrfG
MRRALCNSERNLYSNNALEPDVALNYDQLGTAYSCLQQQGEAVKSFSEAIKRDAHLASPHFGLAKILQHQKSIGRR